MRRPPPVVAVASNLLSKIEFHAVYEPYLYALARNTSTLPLIVPCLGTMTDFDHEAATSLLKQIDGVFLPGSLSNIHPQRYGDDPRVLTCEYDEKRDATTLTLIRAAVEEAVPIFGVCRGMQELNCALGGTLDQEVHAGEGRLDHRAPKVPERSQKYAAAHVLKLSADGWLMGVVRRANLDADNLRVNSLHSQAVETPGRGVVIDARAPDGTVEAISVPGAKALTFGVQWHPEWFTSDTPLYQALFREFDEACQNRRQQRLAS
jgi:putative glutamine amidotransferase